MRCYMVNSVLSPVIYVISDFPTYNFFFWNFVLVIWTFLVLNLHEFWLYKINDMVGSKPKFAQITRDKICHEGVKSKNLQITKTES